MEPTLPQQLVNAGSGGVGGMPQQAASSRPGAPPPPPGPPPQHSGPWSPTGVAGGRDEGPLSRAQSADAAVLVSGERGGVGSGSAAALVQRQREASARAIGAHGVDVVHAHNRPGSFYNRGSPSSTPSRGDLNNSSPGRTAERLCALGLLLAIAMVGFLTFYAPDSALPARYRRDGKGAFDAGTGSGRVKAVYAPGSARRRRGTFDGSFAAEYDNADKFTMAGTVDSVGMALSTTNRPNKYVQSRAAEAEGALRWMQELEERTRRAAALTMAISAAVDDDMLATEGSTKKHRTGDPCVPGSTSSKDEWQDASKRLRHCELHGVHIAAHCPELCFEVAALAIEEALEDGEIMVDFPMVNEAKARAKSGVPTCVDFDTARCFQTVSMHSCVASMGEDADEWFGVSEMSMMCPRTCSWLLISDGYRFARSYFDSHKCWKQLKEDGTVFTIDSERFYKSMQMEMAQKVHRGGDIDLEFEIKRKRLSIGLPDGWIVQRDAKTKRAFYKHADGTIQWERPKGAAAELSEERFKRFEDDERKERMKQTGTMTMHDRLLHRMQQQLQQQQPGQEQQGRQKAQPLQQQPQQGKQQQGQ